MKPDRGVILGFTALMLGGGLISLFLAKGDVEVESEKGCLIQGPWIDGNAAHFTPLGYTVRVPPGKGRRIAARINGRWQMRVLDVPPGKVKLRVLCNDPWIELN